MSLEVRHPTPGEPVEAVGGSYWITEEKKLPFLKRTLLFWVGVGVVDRSCCGTGSCRYIVVPGFVEQWHSRHEENADFSLVEPVTSPWLQKKIAGKLQEQEKIQQIQFL